MSILFSEIYSKAIALFDDPKITVAFETDKIQYEKLMYVFLQNAIGMFHNPSSIAEKLANGMKEPQGTMEVFYGDGNKSTFELSEDFIILDNSKYSFVEGDKKVTGKIEKIQKEIPVEAEWDIETEEVDENGNPVIITTTDNTGVILKESYTVTFPDTLPKGQQYAVEQYYCGEFDVDFSNLNSNAPNKANMIKQQTIGILARLLVLAWAESQRNDYVEVRNILTDTDFKLHPASSMLKSSNEWIRQLNLEVNEMQTRLGWIIRFGKSNSNIGRG